MDNHVYSPFIQCFPVDLVITRYPEILSIVPRILCAYCLAVLCHIKYPYGKFLALTENLLIPSCSCVSQKVFEIPFGLPKILSSLLLLKFLPACIMVNSICLAIFLKILCDSHFDPIDSTGVHMHATIK